MVIGSGSKPNIILIHTDDQEMDTVTAQVMPYLASEPRGSWIKLPNALLSTPLCYPARANMQTGQRADHNGQVTNSGAPPPFNQNNTIGAWMKAAGYRTGMIGKYLNAYPWTTVSPVTVPSGWDTWYASGTSTEFTNFEVVNNSGAIVTETGYATDVQADNAVAFVNAVDARPFFLHFNPLAPHNPSTPATRHASLTYTLTDPPDFNEADLSDKPPWLQAMPLLSSAAQTTVRSDRVQACRSLRSLDEAIEALINALAASGKLENTVIVYMTDNSVAMGRKRLQSGEIKKKNPYYFCFRGLVRIRWPGVLARTDPVLANNLDIIATFVDLAGGTAGMTQDGRSLVPRILGTNTAYRHVAEFTYRDTSDPQIPPWWAVFDGRYKFSRTGATSPFLELYDWQTDPAEMTNVAGQPAYASIQSSLSSSLDALIANAHAYDNSAGGPAPVALTVRGKTAAAVRRGGVTRTVQALAP